MSDDQDRQDFYKAFDKAVDLTRSDVKSKVHLTTSSIDFTNGAVTLCDRHCKVLATVNEDGRITYPTKQATPPTKPAAAPQPGPEVITRAKLNASLKRLLNMVGKRVRRGEGDQFEVSRTLATRVAALETSTVNKSLDEAGFDAMAEMAERLEAMETRLAAAEERAWPYRGYWREGMKSQRNDAVTHNGSLFLALRDTGETPDSSSVDWAVIARKGRDGKDAK